MKLVKKIFIDILRVAKDKGVDKCIEYVENRSDLKIKNKDSLRKRLKTLDFSFKKRLKAVYRSWKQFETKNHDWMLSEFDFDFFVNNTNRIKPATKRGAPKKSFKDLSKDYRRSIITAHSKDSGNDVQLALESLKVTGRRGKNFELESIIKEVIKNQRGVYKKLFQTHDRIQKMSSDEALELLLNLNLTKFQYQQIRLEGKSRDSDIFPSYENVREAKKKARPEGILISETIAEVSYQKIIEHTATRLIHSIEPSIVNVTQGETSNLIMYFNTGFDGTTGFKRYDQNFVDCDNAQYEDGLISTIIVPLSISFGSQQLWKNPTPHSDRFVRPIKFEYAKETKEKIQQMKHDIENQINKISNVQITLSSGVKIIVQPDIRVTAVDGKVRSVLNGMKIMNKSY